MATDGNQPERDPLRGAAVLRVTLERRREGLSSPTLNELYRDVLQDLGVTDEDVLAYLAGHRAEVEAAIDARRKAR